MNIWGKITSILHKELFCVFFYTGYNFFWLFFSMIQNACFLVQIIYVVTCKKYKMKWVLAPWVFSCVVLFVYTKSFLQLEDWNGIYWPFPFKMGKSANSFLQIFPFCFWWPLLLSFSLNNHEKHLHGFVTTLIITT